MATASQFWSPAVITISLLLLLYRSLFIRIISKDSVNNYEYITPLHLERNAKIIGDNDWVLFIDSK